MRDASDREIGGLRGWGTRYGFAVLVTALAALMRWGLDPLLHDTSQYLLFYFSVTVAALVAGTGPGVLAILLGAVTGTGYFVFVGHLGPSWADDISRMALFVLFGAVATALAGRLHEARDRAARTAEALRRSSEQVRLQAIALEAAPNAISLSKTDSEGTIVWVNPAFTALTGYRAEEAMGRTHRILSSGVQDAAFYRNLWETIARGEVWHGELVNRRKDGTLYQEEMGVTPLRDEQGRITHYVAVKQDITQRKEVEAALRESEGRFRSLAEAVPLMIWQCGPDRGCEYFNRSWLEFTGRSMEQERGIGWAEGVHPEDVERCLAIFAAAAERHEPFELEYRLRHRSGEYRWVLDRGRPRISPDGIFLGYIGGCMDIQDRKRAEETLRESERKYRIVADHTYDWEFWLGPDGRFLYCSPSCQRVTGYESAAFLADPDLLGRIVHPEDRAIYAAHLGSGQACATEEAQFRIVHRGGGIRWIDHICHPLYDERGGFLGVRGSNRDITDRKQAEEALRAVSAELQRTLDTAATGLTHCSRDLRYLSVNPAYARWIGLPREQIIGRPIAEVLGQAAFQAIQPHVERVLRGERVEYEADLPYPGGVRPIHAVYTPDWDSAGQVIGWVASVADISEQRRAAQELRAAKARAEQAQRAAESATLAKDQFLAVLSHELRNPLAAVLPALAVLEGLVAGEGGEYLEVARRNVELEARLIDDLLDVTRIARGKIELDRQMVEMCTILNRAAEVCRPDIEVRRLHFGIKVEDGTHPVHGDAARLQQVFWNLIKNAVKFTPPGGYVGVHCWRESERAIVQVTDSGDGIEPEALARIFNAFEQEARSTTRQFGGLGLGLAISKALVELHGGSIRAHSDGKGKGAVFTVELPLAVVEAAAGEKRPAQAASAGDAAGGRGVPRKLRILLVEDHGDTARIMKRLLSAEGHEVRHAGDVATALELAGREPFDMVLSDLGLPDGSGLDLMRQLRSGGNTVRGIALSGYGMAADVQRSREVGFAEHLIKPVNFDSLQAALTRVATAPLPPAAAK